VRSTRLPRPRRRWPRPGRRPFRPWLATAGTGDVLAGAIGAVVAGAGSTAHLGPLAATGVWLHGRAASLAAADLGAAGGPITALDVAAALPRADAEAIAAR